MPDRDDDDVRQPGSPDEAALAIVARHALHDEELVAALAAGALDADDEADERARARGLVDRCPACRAVHDDVAAIGGALRTASAFTARAPRDFRLTVDDAHRLGGTVITRRVRTSIRALLLGVARPMGASIAALGVVGLLVGSAALGAGGATSGAAVDQGASGAAAAPTSVAVEGQPEAPRASERTAFDGSGGVFGLRDDSGPGPIAWLFGISVLAILLGIAMFMIGVRAGRGPPARTPDR